MSEDRPLIYGEAVYVLLSPEASRHPLGAWQVAACGMEPLRTLSHSVTLLSTNDESLARDFYASLVRAQNEMRRN